MKHPSVLVPAILAGLAFLASVLLYGSLPRTMAIHWNIHGEADGFAPRPVAAFVLPVLILLLSGLRGIAQRFEPRAPNLQRSSKALTAAVIAAALLVASVHLAILAAGLGMAVNAPAIAIGGTGLLLAVSGNYMGKTRSNFAIGIRNRWTLSDERVWDVTHRVAGRVLVAEGIVALLVALTGHGEARTVLGLLAVVIGTLFFLHWYSLRQWRKRFQHAKR